HQTHEVPSAVMDQLMPPMPGAAPSPEVVDERFDISVNKVSASDFFRSLVSGTHYNMVVHPDVKGEVSLDLKDVSVGEVMDIMRNVYGYDYQRSGRLYQVFPDAMRTEILHIDYLNVGRKGQSEMQVSAGTLTDSQNNGNNLNGAYVNNGFNGYVQQGAGNTNSNNLVGTQVNTDSDANFWTELQATLTSIIGNVPGSSVVVTPQVGIVVVHAMPNALQAVRKYLERAQLMLRRQVILEAKVIEVTLKSGFEAGIDWNTFGKNSGGSFNPIVDADGNVIAAGSNNNVAGQFTFGQAKQFFNPNDSEFTINMSFSDFEGVIRLLETQGAVQVLSSPRIQTVNNQKAVIKVGSDEYFVTNISTTTVTAGSAINTSDSPQLTPFFSGIALDVTPEISESGEVILHVHPTVSEVTQQNKIIAGQNVPLAASTIRESDSVVRASSGQIIVIGGLMQTTSGDSDSGVPWLSHLPVLGYAFKQKQQSGVKSELVILLRPVVSDDQAQIDAMNESLAHVKALKTQLDPRSAP
ncbi:MAG TPA: pilus (MSHA type) biogenesis protein MshL, partial [Pseudomonadales bacterium]|nr:pilus (MSHA type) biogenesis protein MshL [Pseudomonadales bacterium]